MKRFSFLLLAGLLIGCGGGGGGGGGETSGSGSAPIVTTPAATSITPTSAILSGTVIPNGLQSQSWFEYGTDSSLATYTSSPKQDAGSGLTSQAANMTWSSLAAGTTYYYRFCAENSKGNSKGLIISFTTSSPGNPPTVATLSTTSVGATVSTLNGDVSPNGLATTAWFEWGTDSSMTIYSNTTTQSVGSGTTSLLVTLPLSGLSTGTTYYYRVAASNSSGTTKGSTVNFTPGAAPTVTTLTATSVTATTTTLNGDVTTNGLVTNAWFEYGTDPTLASSTSTSSQSVGSGTTIQPVNAALTGLTTGTTYYFRVTASNSSGASKGNILSFIPGAAPAVTTLAATFDSPNIVNLSGSVIPNGLPSTAWFESSTDPNLTTFSSTSPMSVGSGTTSQSFGIAAHNIYAIGTTYYYRAAANNSSGTTKGSIVSFTPNAAPTVQTLAADSLSVTGATLHASVIPNGLATNAYFEWGTDSTFAVPNVTPTQSVGSDTTSHQFNAVLSGLTTGTKYYYRVVASNSTGTSQGTILSFTTGTAPKWTFTGSMGTARSGHTATLLGNGKVLISGGSNGSVGLSSAELYDPGTGSFSTTGSMGAARSGHTATLLGNGKVLIAGGGVGNSAELYDPATGSFSPTGSSGTLIQTATLLSNGKVLVTGGDNNSASLYDPATGTFSLTGSMGTTHSNYTATLLANGKVLIVGGINFQLILVPPSTLYDPATGTFSTTGSMVDARAFPTTTLLPNGKVLVVGGYFEATHLSAELYDTSMGTFSSTGSMGTPRHHNTATLMPNGKVLVTGGSNEGTLQNSAELYDPATGTFSPTWSMGLPRVFHMATLLPNGKVLITGGGNGSGSSTAELYDPGTGE